MKVNASNDNYLVGYTKLYHTEVLSKTLILSAMEVCTPEVIEFLIRFGADLSKPYEGKVFVTQEIFYVKFHDTCILIVPFSAVVSPIVSVHGGRKFYTTVSYPFPKWGYLLKIWENFLSLLL